MKNLIATLWGTFCIGLIAGLLIASIIEGHFDSVGFIVLPILISSTIVWARGIKLQP